MNFLFFLQQQSRQFLSKPHTTYGSFLNVCHNGRQNKQEEKLWLSIQLFYKGRNYKNCRNNLNIMRIISTYSQIISVEIFLPKFQYFWVEAISEKHFVVKVTLQSWAHFSGIFTIKCGQKHWDRYPDLVAFFLCHQIPQVSLKITLFSNGEKYKHNAWKFGVSLLTDVDFKQIMITSIQRQTALYQLADEPRRKKFFLKRGNPGEVRGGGFPEGGRGVPGREPQEIKRGEFWGRRRGFRVL